MPLILSASNKLIAHASLLQWIRDTPLISLLIGKLGPDNEWCEQASVEQLLCDVLDSSGAGVSTVTAAAG